MIAGQHDIRVWDYIWSPCSPACISRGVIHDQIIQYYILAGNVNLWLFWVVSLQLTQFLLWRLKSLNSFRVYSFRQIQDILLGDPVSTAFYSQSLTVGIVVSILLGDKKPARQPGRQRTRSKPAFPRFFNLERFPPNPESTTPRPHVQDNVHISSSFHQISP